MVTVKVKSAYCHYGQKTVLEDINFIAKSGEITIVIGPNGAGKTTLLKMLAGIVRPSFGEVYFDGKRLSEMSRNDISKIVSYLPQENVIPGILTVFEVVLLGRIPYLTWKIGKRDLDITRSILQELGIEHHAKRFANQLSGGERQVVLVAQALVREPQILLLDEPVSNLDIKNQLEILDLIKRITKERGVTTILVLHDLNLAARYADKLLVLNSGKIFAEGEPKDVLREDIISAVYGIEAEIKIEDKRIQVIPLRPIK